jgi:transcriptional regulator with XRE-family HTH domain
VSKIRGTQQVLPFDWLILDASSMIGTHKGAALFMRLLSAARRRQGTPQTEVARRMGISSAGVSKLETGHHSRTRRMLEPRLSTILRYAQAAEIETSYVQLAFTVVLVAEFHGAGTFEQVRENLTDVVSAVMLTPA